MFGAVIAVSRLHNRAAPHCGGFAVAKTFKQCLSQEVSQCKLQQSTLGVRQFVTWRTLLTKKSARKDDFGWGSRFRRTMSLFYAKVKIPGKEKIEIPDETNPLKVNTKVRNNVMLYRFEKPYLYKGAIIFGGAALVGCLAMADNVYLILCRDLFKSDVPLLTRLYQHILPLTFIAIGLLAGPAIFITVWYITKRTVKYIVLHKGGNTATIVTYHPLKGETTMTVPIDNVSALSGRTAAKSYVPLKIRGTRLKYIVDKNGHFVNQELFDVTVGSYRFS